MSEREHIRAELDVPERYHEIILKTKTLLNLWEHKLTWYHHRIPLDDIEMIFKSACALRDSYYGLGEPRTKAEDSIWWMGRSLLWSVKRYLDLFEDVPSPDLPVSNKRKEELLAANKKYKETASYG